MRTFLAGIIAAAGLAAPSVAQTPDAGKLQALYSQICADAKAASTATCAGLERDLAAMAPSTDPEAVERRRAAAEQFVSGFGGGRIAPGQLWSGRREELRQNIAAKQNLVASFGPLKSLTWLRNENGLDVYSARHEVGVVEWRILMRPDGSVVTASFQDSRRVNANRSASRNASWVGKDSFIDPIVPGQRIQAVFEGSDGSIRGWPWREDCYRVMAPPGTALKVSLYVKGITTASWVGTSCAYGGQYSTNYGADNAYGVHFQQGAQPLYILVSGRAMSNQPYEILLETQTPQQVAQYQAEQRQRQIAEQRRREAEAQQGNSGFLGGMLMAVGAAAAGGNAEMVTGAFLKGVEMSTDNEMSRNVLAGQGDQMIAAGAQRMAEQNQMRLAQAQAQAQAQQQAQARAQAEQQAQAQAQARQAAQDRQAATVAFGNARSQIEQKLREASASGDAQQQAFWLNKLRENETLANQYGVDSQVRQYAQNQIQTQRPAQRQPAPTAAPAPRAAQSQSADKTPIPRNETRAQIIRSLSEGGSVDREVRQAGLSTPGRSPERTCITAGYTKEWTTVGLVSLDDARKEYEEARRSPCRGGGGTISPIKCGNVITVLGNKFTSCTAVISCPSRQSTSCGSQVSPQ